MKIIKRSNSDISTEEAHGGSGTRKVYVNGEQLESANFDIMAHGFLPAGNKYALHNHIDIEEIMVVLKGEGKVIDEDGEYTYSPGDVFIFPANVNHEIFNNSSEEHEMVFVRIKLKSSEK